MTKKEKDEILIAAFLKKFSSVPEQLNYISNEAAKLTGSKCVFIYFYDKAEGEFTPFSDRTADRPDNTAILKEVAKTVKPLVINDFARLRPDNPAAASYRNIMFIPVISEEGLAAVIGFANKQTRYTTSDVYAVKILMSGIWHDIERKKREMELLVAVEELKASEARLRQILNSTSDAIFGFDQDVVCTFCNRSALELLGLKHEDDLVGKQVRNVLKYNFARQTKCDDKIAKVLNEGIAAASEKEEIFYRVDGSTFYIEYNAYPQYYEGKVVGAVVSFSDITDHVIREKELLLSSYLDILTGIYNRRFFETESVKLDAEENYPLSIIIGDINGLKIVNDIFGHQAGDKLLQRAAKILNEHRRPKDILARWGGDEFIMMLPNTT